MNNYFTVVFSFVFVFTSYVYAGEKKTKPLNEEFIAIPTIPQVTSVIIGVFQTLDKNRYFSFLSDGTFVYRLHKGWDLQDGAYERSSCAVTDAVTNEPMTLHQTWISPDGHKLFDPPRMLLAGHQVSGGIIRLWPDDKITYGLGIAEGIETALSAAHGFQPIWSTVNKSNLNKFPVLDAVEVLTILADPEGAGIAAANNCGRRWLDAEREVRIWESECHDFNDWAGA